jgi:hypothetical protein
MTVLILLTVSCSSQKQAVIDQQNLLIKMPQDLPLVEGKTGESWVRMSIEWRAQYNECTIRQHGLIDAINKNQEK